MNCFTIKVSEPPRKLIHVHPISGTNIKVSEISSASIKVYSVTDPKISKTTLKNYSAPNIQLSECIAQLPSDFNNRIFAVISGDIVAATGVSISAHSGKIYLNSILYAGSGISLSYSSGIYTISSSTVSQNNSNHQHIINDIIGLQNALNDKQPSGLLPVTNIIGGTNISINNTDSVFTIDNIVSYSRGWFLS